MSNAFDYMDREIAAGRMNNLSAGGIFNAVGASVKTRAAYTKGLTDEIERTKDLARTTNDLGKTQDRYNKYQLETGGALINNVSVLDTVKSGFKSFASTAGSIAANIGTNMLINAGIQAVGWGIDKVVNAQSDKIKAGTEVLDNYKSVNQEMAQATSWVQTNADRYELLAKGVSNLGENLNLTNDEYAEYQSLASEIAQQFPSLVTGYDSLGKPIIGTARNAKDLETALKNQKVEQYTESIKNASDVTDKFYEETMRSKKWAWQDAGYQKQLKALNTFKDEYDKAFKGDDDNAPTGFMNPDEFLHRVTDKFNSSNFRDAYKSLGLSDSDVTELIGESNLNGGSLKSDSDAQKTLTTLMDGISEMQTNVDMAASELKGYIPSFLQANKKYQDLAWDNKSLDGQVTSMINAMTMKDLNTLGFTDKDDAEKNIRSWSSKAVKELENADLRNAIDAVFNVDTDSSNKSFRTWSKEADAALDAAADKSQELGGAWDRTWMREASGIKDTWEELNDYRTDITKRWGEDNVKKLWTDADFSIDQYKALGQMATDKNYSGAEYDDFNYAISVATKLQRATELTADAMKKVVTAATTNLSSMQTAISESMSDSGMSADSIKNMSDAFNDLNKSAEDYSFSKGDMFKETANGVKLNTTALGNLLKAQHKIKNEDFAQAIQEQANAIENQYEAIKKTTDEGEKTKAQSELSTMLDDLAAMQQAQSQYNALYKQQQEALSDYGQWINAQSTENAGDKYTNMVSGLKTALEAYNKGLTGTDDFKTFAKMISPTGATDEANFAENYSRAARYLTEDASGVKNFLNDLQTKGLADFNKETEQWAINVTDVAEAAKKMGMGKDFMSNMFGRLEDYGFHNNVVTDTQDGVLKLTDAYGNLADAEARLKQLKDTDPGNTTAIKEAQAEVDGYKQDIQDLNANTKEAASKAISDYSDELDRAKTEMDVLERARKEVMNSDQDESVKKQMLSGLESKMLELKSEYSDLFEDYEFKTSEELAKEASEYQEAIKNASIENPVTPDFGDDKDAAKNYEDTVAKIQKANEDGNKVLSDSLDTLSGFTAEQLQGIDLFDGKYDSEELAPAEQAMDNIVSSLQLSKEQAAGLWQVFESMGLLKTETDTSGLDNVITKGKEAQETLEAETGKTYKFDFDTTDIDTVQKQLKEIEEDVDKHVKKDKNGNPQYIGSQAEEDTYKASVAQEQKAEYENSVIGQSDSKGKIIQAAQEYMKAKNELDAETQYSQKGMENDVQGARDKAEAAQATLKDLADKNGINSIDFSDLQTTEDSLLGMESDKTLKVKADVDTSDAESKVQELKNLDGSTLTINADISSNNGVEQLENSLASIPQGVSTTVNCTVDGQSDVDNLESAMSSVPNDTPVTITCHVDNQEQWDQLETKANELNASGKDIKLEGTIGDIKTDGATASTPVEVTGNITVLTASAGLTPVAVTGNVVQLTGTPSQPVNVNANATTISGNPSGTVDVATNATAVSGSPSGTVDVHGNVTEASGSPSGTVDVKGNVTSVTGSPSGTVQVHGELVGNLANGNQSTTVKVNKDSSSVDGYKPSNKTATVKFSKDSSIPDGYQPSDKSAKVNYDLGTTPSYDPPNYNRTVTYTIKTVGSAPADKANVATGTMTSIARSSGTAYNVLNTKRLSPAHANGNVALKHNEQALVNEVGINGHSESIVRDGVWSLIPGGAHIENLKRGDIIFSATQTEALLKNGRISGHARAYAQGSLTNLAPAHAGLRGAGIKDNRNLGSSSKGSGSSGNTGTTTKTDPQTKKKDTSKWSDPWKNAKDWFERVIKKLQNIIDLNKAKADNDYKYQQKNLLADNSMDTTERLIKNYKAAVKMYTKQSDKYAKTINLPKNLKRKVQNGTVDIQKLSEVNKQKVEAYQKWYDKINDCKKAIEELKTKERELAQQKLENITNRYDALIKVYSNRNSKIDNINSMREELGESQGKGSSYYKSVESQISNGKKMRNYYKDEIYAYELEYNRFAKKYGKNSTEAKEAFATLEELKSNFYENEKNITEYQNKLFELQNTVAGYKVDKYTQASDALESFRKFKEANNYKDSKYGKVTESDYVEAINVNDQTISAIQAQKELVQKQMSKYSIDSSKYQELKKTLADLNKQELEAANSNAELKKSIVDLRFKPFDDAKESLDNLITDFDNLRNMMDSDTFMEDNGSFTKQGLANISLINQAAEATKQQIANYNAQLAAVEKEYQNHNITEEDYKQRTKDLKSSIQQASQSLNGYEQSLIQVYSDQISKENDYLQENIDKRKTALTQKKAWNNARIYLIAGKSPQPYLATA